ncbi:MAG TPA: hypothetical protein VG389_13745 [Myxococcota bacterium]|jgi:hypothetical protein|nr:hypothetical protein [Myxococcota bacterium]
MADQERARPATEAAAGAGASAGGEASSARHAAAALVALDGLGLELERVAQAARDRPARAPLALLAWLDRVLAELAWELRLLERAVALRRRESGTPVAWKELGPDTDAGLGARVAALRPDLVTEGVAGMFAGWLEDVRLRDDHRYLPDMFATAAAVPRLLSRALGEIVAELEPVRAAVEALAGVGPDAPRTADGILDFAARRVRYRLAGRLGWVGLVVRRHLETLRAEREGKS